MPKNKGKGGKNRRRGKNQNEPDRRELVFKDEGQEYALVTRMLGNGRCECSCFDGTTRLGHIRGTMRKKVWINKDDIILVSLRDYQDGKCDIILKYTMDEARNLIKNGQLPADTKLNEGGDSDKEQDDTVVFAEVDNAGDEEDFDVGGDVDIDDL
ncbi:eukaryotic translation initiation factor 4C [Salpingoeca rosetta]|uniref:Eukaryotic translation initiation factor 4C n=1 Tax=Salpingoeca rosetta (strain ATCC 50818 / BSB-021) TaxID=946362 RepID=F2U6D6_SALR5|nr:eukaryotic translation initiation factor 4C [Salpingoeca rosetta]EGD83077.1 eukaryotic translation initiation factor 4C [Salpingoeca rosetta]|eukprot:XP_004995441.1 eukaryotic translation initiation factor 4C [Salpingoeca rosetta]